jgi:CDP-glycerol glycerophosphotransferase (TagB/SpsB family)
MGVIRHLRDLIRFTQLPKQQRRLTFYSEGKNYWPHLTGLVQELLATSDLDICYISSGADDPGLFLENPNYQAFKIDEGFMRDWLFENIETDVMVMTTPDLHQHQLKRSKHKVHYIYVQHSLVSLHMAYRKGAFDYYDTIFCAGPHHVNEIRAMEERYKLPRKNLLEHGYARLDAIIEEAKRRPRKEKSDDAPKHVLIAPSWGPEGTIESGIAEKIIDQLMLQGCQVTLRPHPETRKSAKEKIDHIRKKHDRNTLFSYEANVAGQESLHDSDLMISDWSGAAMDYSFGLDRPVLFIDVPRKANNKDYEELEIEPFEVYIRERIGVILELNFSTIDLSLVDKMASSHREDNVFNICESALVGGQYIRNLLET